MYIHVNRKTCGRLCRKPSTQDRKWKMAMKKAFCFLVYTSTLIKLIYFLYTSKINKKCHFLFLYIFGFIIVFYLLWRLLPFEFHLDGSTSKFKLEIGSLETSATWQCHSPGAQAACRSQANNRAIPSSWHSFPPVEVLFQMHIE